MPAGSQVSGTDLVVALYDENVSYGVPPLTPFNGRVGYMSKCGLAAERGLVESPIITGGRAQRKVGIGNTSVGGSIETTIAPETIGFWLKHMLSAPTTAGTAPPYTHTFRIGTMPIGFTLEKDYTKAIAGKVERFSGCRIASAEFDFQQENFAGLTLNVIGRSHDIVAAALDSTLDDSGHSGYSGFNGRVLLDGVALAGVTGMRLKIDNSMPGGPFCFEATEGASGLRSGNPEGRCKISGTLDLVLQDFALLDKAKARNDASLSVQYYRGTGLGTTGNEKIVFNSSSTQFTYRSPPLDTESGMLISLDFMSFSPGAQDAGGFHIVMFSPIPNGSL